MELEKYVILKRAATEIMFFLMLIQISQYE